VHPIDPSLAPEACAAAYEADLKKSFDGKDIVFDLILLGMGRWPAVVPLLSR
jgi:6-phosphogluconolactonase/glucosamine-6-phosphate isomerase/deaminase